MKKSEFVRRLNNPIPEIGDTFKIVNPDSVLGSEHSWRCTGYMKLVTPETMKYDEDKHGLGAMLNNLLIDSAQKKDGKIMMWCAKEEATHVTGAGVCGCMEKLSDIEVTGRVPWDDEMIQSEIDQHERLIGQYVD